MNQNLGYLLSDSSRLLRKTFDERVRGLGLTSVQARLLLSLTKFPDNNQAFYAERLEVEPITLTRLVDRMEEAGWIERVPDPTDRRARLLHLTDKAEAILGKVREAVDGLVADMTEGFSPGERAAMADLLTRISSNLAAQRPMMDAANG